MRLELYFYQTWLCQDLSVENQSQVIKRVASRVVQIGVENPKTQNPGSCLPLPHLCKLFPVLRAFTLATLLILPSLSSALVIRNNCAPFSMLSVNFTQTRGVVSVDCRFFHQFGSSGRAVPHSSLCADTNHSLSHLGAPGTKVYGYS